MAIQIQLRRGTAANWTSVNPTLASGEAGVETDTGRVKFGNGTSAWNSLAYPPIAGGVPVGGIIMWSGTIATIPATWALCDGTANSPGPDLRDKFVVGAKQDDSGIAKSNILGVLSQSGGTTGHSHSGHANLTHAGGLVGDHTGLTHGLSIANHPDLTHALISLPGLTHPILTIEGQTHAVQSLASRNDLTVQGFTHPLLTIEGMTHAVQSIASRADLSAAGLTHADISFASTAGVASFATSTNRSGLTARAATTLTIVSHPTHVVSHPAWSISPVSHPTFTASAPASHPTGSVSMPAWSISPASHPTFTASAPASHPSATTSIAGHVGTDYGVHTFTAPAAHGTAGTLTHSFTQPNDHVISAHDIVSQIPSFFALAFIQRMS